MNQEITNQIFIAVASGLILMVLGSIGTGMIWISKWFSKKAIKIEKDLNAAHVKLREQESRILDLEEVQFDRE